MSVFNAERYVGQAIESILNQSFDNFEFIIINDGSTDRSRQVIKGFDDPRIQRIDQSNRGVSAAINRGIRMSQCEYIARMDADDLAYPTRIERQLEFLDAHPDLALLGCAVQVIDHLDQPMWVMHHPIHDLNLRWHLLFDTPFVHSSVIFRRDVVEAVGLYDEEQVSHVEDYQLWSLIMVSSPAANLAEPLLCYRNNPSGISHSKRSAQEVNSLHQSATNIGQLLGEEYTFERAQTLRGLRNVTWPPPNLKAVCRASNDLERLLIAFQKLNATPWARQPHVRRSIQRDKARAQLIAAFFAGYHGARRSALRKILRALASRPAAIASISLYRAFFVLGLGFEPYKRLRRVVNRRGGEPDIDELA